MQQDIERARRWRTGAQLVTVLVLAALLFVAIRQ
jgi:hypothetical protein